MNHAPSDKKSWITDPRGGIVVPWTTAWQPAAGADGGAQTRRDGLWWTHAGRRRGAGCLTLLTPHVKGLDSRTHAGGREGGRGGRHCCSVRRGPCAEQTMHHA